MGTDHRPQVIVSYQRLAALIVKDSGLHEGHWQVALTVGASSGFLAQMPGGAIVPAFWTPIMGVSLLRQDTPNALTVDAAEVNPAQKGAALPTGEWRCSCGETCGAIRLACERCGQHKSKALPASRILTVM